MSAALTSVLAVDTGVVVIAVAAAVALVVLIVALSVRGRQMRSADRRRDLGAQERAGRADKDQDPGQGLDDPAIGPEQ